MEVLIYILMISGVLLTPPLLINFFYFLVTQRLALRSYYPLFVVLFLVGPLLYCIMDDRGVVNNCCEQTAFLAAPYKLSVYIVASLGVLAALYCSLRKQVAPPLLELLVNCLLLMGMLIFIFLALQTGDLRMLFFGLPPCIVFIFLLVNNHWMLIEQLENSTKLRGFYRILTTHPWLKFPVLLVLCVPLLVLILAVLYVFGQEPDSLVKAFTQTYKQGFSQLDSQCDHVDCGGHFLCTIAAKGSPSLVKPQRTGQRAGGTIVCNRQLLISNAFEEWLEEYLPWVHRPIRRFYNRIGAFIHRYYGAFNRPWVSNLIYVLMKPLEYLFLLVLYSGARNPESRIARQYMSRDHRLTLKQATNHHALISG